MSHHDGMYHWGFSSKEYWYFMFVFNFLLQYELENPQFDILNIPYASMTELWISSLNFPALCYSHECDHIYTPVIMVINLLFSIYSNNNNNESFFISIMCNGSRYVGESIVCTLMVN